MFRMLKKRYAVLLILVLLLSACASQQSGTNSVKGNPFADIQESVYKNDILYLYSNSIISAGGTTYSPDANITNAGAVEMIVRAFKIADYKPLIYKDNPDLEKKYVYSGTLEAINESFMVPSARDIADSPALPYIEAAYSSAIVDQKKTMFYPDSSISGKDFAQLIANCLYGPMSGANTIDRAVRDGFIPGDLSTAAGVTRGSAAKIIADILRNRNLEIITVFVTSDIHGNLVPYMPAGSKVMVGSLAKMSYIINKMRAVQPNLLLIDAGDSPYNTNIANFVQGKSTVDVMNAMRYDATALGNHDFDYAFDILLSNADRANYAFLSANTFWNDGKYPAQFKPSISKKVGSIKVGIGGITDDTSKLYTHFTNTEDIMFKEHFSTAEELVKKLDKENDLVIMLSHLHGDNPELLKRVAGINISVGGGNDLAGQPSIINGAWLINPGKHAECLNQINVTMFKKQMIGVVFNQIYLNPDMPDDPAVTAITGMYEKQLDDQLKKVIGKTAVDLNGERSVVRVKESNLANAVADSLRESMQADIAFQNGGGVRASIPQGDITMGHVYSVLPFDNKVILVETSGATVRTALENGAAQLPAAAGQFLQVSGLAYTLDMSQAPGKRVVSVTIDGREIDPAKRYKVVINDFMAGGGDGFTMLKCMGSGENAPDVKIILSTNYYLRDIFTEYVEKKGTISPKTENRILFK